MFGEDQKSKTTFSQLILWRYIAQIVFIYKRILNSQTRRLKDVYGSSQWGDDATVKRSDGCQLLVLHHQVSLVSSLAVVDHFEATAGRVSEWEVSSMY